VHTCIHAHEQGKLKETCRLFTAAWALKHDLHTVPGMHVALDGLKTLREKGEPCATVVLDGVFCVCVLVPACACVCARVSVRACMCVFDAENEKRALRYGSRRWYVLCVCVLCVCVCVCVCVCFWD
jgi:hypothetical protein